MGQSICSKDRCTRPVRARGLCGGHYEQLRLAGPLGPRPERPRKPKGVCEIQNCGQPVVARGWCVKHYDHWRIHSDPVLDTGIPPRVCTEGGCGRPAKSRDLCAGHAARVKRTGSPGGSLDRVSYPKTCTVPGCDTTTRAKGYCTRHYDRWKATGDPGPAGLLLQPAKGLTCKLDGCDEARAARGFCAAHRRRVKLYGDAGPGERKKRKPRGVPCEVPKCPKLAHAGGMCSMHYARKMKHGDPGGVERQLAPKGQGYVNSDGYRIIYVDGKSLLEHRHVMATHLRRPLTHTESVHHKDGNRSRNVISNLELWVKTNGAQPYGQRVGDLIDYLVEFHWDDAKAARKRFERERRTGQLHLEGMPAAHVSEAS